MVVRSAPTIGQDTSAREGIDGGPQLNTLSLWEREG